MNKAIPVPSIRECHHPGQLCLIIPLAISHLCATEVEGRMVELITVELRRQPKHALPTYYARERCLHLKTLRVEPTPYSRPS